MTMPAHSERLTEKGSDPGNLTPFRTTSHAWLFWTVALFGLAVDQASKYGLFAYLYSDKHPYEETVEIIPGAFRLIAQYTPQRETGDGLAARLRTISGELLPRVNHGALFGFGGRNEQGQDANHLFAIVSVVAALAIVFWSSRPSATGDRLLCLALGCILAGTLGNLFDRLVFSGVRDFLHWYYLVDWPVFNFADCCLVCGAGLLLLQAFLAEVRKPVAQLAPELAAEPEIAEVK